jgi:hypothetical protein
MLLKIHLPIYICVNTAGSDHGAISPKHVIQRHWNIVFSYSNLSFWREKQRYITNKKSTSGFFYWSLLFRLFNQNFLRTSEIPTRATWPAHIILLDLIMLIIIWWRVQIMELLVMRLNLFITLIPYVLLRPTLSDTLSLCSSLKNEIPSFIPIQCNKWNYNFECYNL